MLEKSLSFDKICVILKLLSFAQFWDFQLGVDMATEIQTAQDIWPELASIVFVPRTENDYQRLSALRDDLITFIGESENHPLNSLMEVVGALIEKYESEQESTERESWYRLSMQMLARAYGEDEPEYTTDMLKWVNPDYEVTSIQQRLHLRGKARVR